MTAQLNERRRYNKLKDINVRYKLKVIKELSNTTCARHCSDVESEKRLTVS